MTTKQGQAIMLFTIVTIIFVRALYPPHPAEVPQSDIFKLPLSFFTSYFGQNVRELTADEKNPRSNSLWRIAGK